MARTLKQMPKTRFIAKSGSDVANYIIQGNETLVEGLNGQTFTRDNFVELGNVIFNDPNLRTQFIYELYDKIGLTYVADYSYTNPLKFFKKDALNNGSIVEEMALDVIEPMPYNPEINWSKALKNFMPTYGEIFHKLNRAQVYPITLNETLLRRAMTSEGAFLDFINEQMKLLSTSNEVDEFGYFLDLINYIATNRAYPIEVTITDDRTGWEKLVAKINETAMLLTFPSRKYNLFNFNRSTPLERLVFITTAEISSKMNVYVNAPAYNLEFVKLLSERTVIVPSLPKNCYGLLLDERTVQIYDVLYATDNNHNGLTRSENTFLHVQQIISSSLQFNAVALYSEVVEPTSIEVVNPAVNSTLNKGQATPIEVKVADSTYQQVTYSLSGNVSPNTQITPYGLLYVGQDETASVLTVTVTSYDGKQTKTLTYNVGGNAPIIQSITPPSGSTLKKGQSYSVFATVTNTTLTPTYTLKTQEVQAGTKLDGNLLSIDATETKTPLEVEVKVGATTQTASYTVID